jgi:hypothetical protein
MLLTIFALIVSAAIDSTTLFIGDQTDLHLRATAQPEEQVTLPVLDNELIPGIEIVDRTIIDTIQLADGRLQYDQYLTITSFQDSLFYIAPLPFVSGSDTIYSDALTLNVVQPFELDSTDIAITDIKGIYRAPIWWWGIIRWILLVLALALAGVGMHYLIEYIKRHRALQTEDAAPMEPLRPAEVVALEKLDAIREEKIWQKGQVKEYHTQLTDVIREYIARRFQVSSVEQTSDETLRDIRPLLTDKGLYQSLAEMLRLADLVKFAKWTTTPDENENALRTAYHFVQQTTPVEEPQQQA